MLVDRRMPKKMLRQIGCARAEAYSLIDNLRYACFVGRADIVSTLEGVEGEYERRRNSIHGGDAYGFDTSMFMDAIQVLRDALERGDTQAR